MNETRTETSLSAAPLSAALYNRVHTMLAWSRMWPGTASPVTSMSLPGQLELMKPPFCEAVCK
jgi:hypothetical protein